MRRLLAAAALVIAGALPATADALAFPGPSTIDTSTTENASPPALAVAPTGSAVAAWQYSAGVFGRRAPTPTFRVLAALRQPGGGFAAPVQLSTAGVSTSTPRVAVDAAGDVTVAWTERSASTGVIRVATAPAGQPFGPAVDVSLKGSSDISPSLTEDAAGDAVIAWVAGRAIVATTRSGPSGAWAPEATVATGVTGSTPTQPALAMNPAGTLALSYSNPPTSSSSSSVIYALRRPLGGAFGAPVALTPDSESNFARSVTIDPANRITTAYENNAGSGGMNSFSIRASTLAADGTTVGAEQTLTPGALTLDSPSLASDTAGNVTAVWSRFFPIAGNSGINHIETSTAPAGQPFAPLTSLDPTNSSDAPSIADDPAGDTIIAWGSTPNTSSGTSSLMIVQRPSGGAFAPAQNLGPVGFDTSSVALAAPNNATVAWALSGSTGGSSVLASATGSGTAGAATPTATPTATVTATVTATPTATPIMTPYELPKTFRVTLKLATHQTLKTVRHRKAIRATCALPSAGTCTVKATLKHKKRTVLVAKGSATLTAAGSHKIKLKLTRKGRKVVKHRHTALKLKIRATASDAGGDHAAGTKRLKLKPR